MQRAWTVAIIVGCVSLAALSSVWAQPLNKPNILFILIDDMGWPDPTCYGNPFNETPNIDRLAAQGMRFTDFYAATPVCSSTRSTIQSGQYSARTGVSDFIPGHWRPFEKLVVPPIDHNLKDGVKTPGDALRAAGYVTGYFGKWHLGGAKHQPDDHGYDVTEQTLAKDPDFKKWLGQTPPGPKRIDSLTRQTLYFILTHKDKPWFVTLSHHSVHIPVEARAGTRKKYEAKPKPDQGVNNPDYAAMVEDLDTTVGQILRLLDEQGLADHTIVVFTSDNGGLRQIYTGVGDLISSNTPLRGQKGTLYEGGIRVPMIVRWPGAVAPATVCREPTTTADLLPTFCAMAGATLPDQPIDGRNMVPLLKDAGATLGRDAIYFHYPHYHHSRPAGALRAGDYKLIEFFDTNELELYNLKDDIGEHANLATKMPAQAAELRRKLAAWRESVGARMPAKNPNYDPDKAHEWWNRGSNTPLDLEAMRKRYETKKP